jgi:lipopolysaccharide transport system permease protein
MLILRDVKLRYNQAVLGVVWVLLQPLLAGIIFAVIFGRFASLPSDNAPYPVFVFTGLVAWFFFSGAIQRASNSLVTNAPLITKTYFPRLLIPLAHTLAVLLDLAVMMLVLAGMLVAYDQPPSLRLFTLPLFVLLMIVAATGVALWLSALSVKYRDFVYVIPFLIQVWMFASPVIYSARNLIPGEWLWVYSLNPAAGFVEGFRWSVLRGVSLSPGMILESCLVSGLIFLTGAYFFRRVERSFADII